MTNSFIYIQQQYYIVNVIFILSSQEMYKLKNHKNNQIRILSHENISIIIIKKRVNVPSLFIRFQKNNIHFYFHYKSYILLCHVLCLK